MAEDHSIGTPPSGERKQRRLHSPLQEMDGVPDQNMFFRQPRFDVEPHTPEAPKTDAAEAAVASSSSVTLEGIRGLLQQEIAPMRTAITQMEQKMDLLSISTETRYQVIEARLREGEERLKALEGQRSGTSTPGSEQTWATQMSKLEDELNELRKSSSTGQSPTDEYECSIVLGGLDAMPSLTEATTWVNNRLWELYGPDAQEVYCKGEYRGIIFVKFSTTGKRRDALRLLKNADCTDGGHDVWIKPNKPLELRVLYSLVFGAKFQLSKYYDKKTIWADVDDRQTRGELWLGCDKIFTATVKDHDLKVDYEQGWQEWINSEEYPEFTTTLNHIKQKLSASPSTGGTKGKGKSKAGKHSGPTRGASGTLASMFHQTAQPLSQMFRC